MADDVAHDQLGIIIMSPLYDVIADDTKICRLYM